MFLLLYFYGVKSRKYLYLGLIIVAILFLGFFREMIFKNINALLQAWDAEMEYPMPAFLKFTESLDYGTVVNLKWLLTLLFSLAYLIISLITVKILFHTSKFTRITIAAYAGIIVLSALFMLAGFLFKSDSEKMYEFARYLMGMAQSPIILMILIPLFKVAEKENTVKL